MSLKENSCVSVLILFLFLKFSTCSPTNNDNFLRNKSDRPHIDVTIVNKPRNLFIGRCVKGNQILHSENIILENDQNAKVNATIRVNIEGPVKITCAKILDNSRENTGYPFFVAGGVGYNFVEVGVTTGFGEGFSFYIEIQGTGNGENKSSSQILYKKLP